LSERYFRRHEAAEYLSNMGLPIAPATLAKYAVIGGGPSFQRWSRFPVYAESALQAWVKERLGVPARSTSQLAGTAA
jgi:hypothetical protein